MQLVLSLLESGYGLTEGTQTTPTAARIAPINTSTPYQISNEIDAHTSARLNSGCSKASRAAIVNRPGGR